MITDTMNPLAIGFAAGLAGTTDTARKESANTSMLAQVDRPIDQVDPSIASKARSLPLIYCAGRVYLRV